MSQTCRNCKFFRSNGEEDRGLCKRYPPTLTQEVDYKELGEIKSFPLSDFPTVLNVDWCGEFKKAEAHLVLG